MIVQHLARSRSRYWDCKISWSTKCWDCKTPCKIDPLITSHQNHHCPQDQPCQRPTLHCLQKQSQSSARLHLVFTKFWKQETYFIDAEAFSLSRQLQCIDWSWWSSPTSVFPNSCLSSRCHRTAPPRLMCGAQTNQLAEEGNKNRKQGNWSIRHDLKGWKSWRCVCLVWTPYISPSMFSCDLSVGLTSWIGANFWTNDSKKSRKSPVKDSVHK